MSIIIITKKLGQFEKLNNISTVVIKKKSFLFGRLFIG